MASKETVLKQKLSKEEMRYQSAVQLMEAVDCVSRFEREVASLRDAAAIFEKLGDYKDAVQRRKDCLEMADQAEERGCRDTFQSGKDKLKAASVKSDYVDAMEQFKRLRKYEPYRERIKPEIQECKKRIRRLETMAAYKRRGIVLLILFLVCLALTQTPVFPVAKGVVHRFRGEYRAALNCYTEAENLPGVNKLKRSCYYKLAKKAEEQNKLKKAMELYRLAWYYSDAPEYTAKLEKELLRQSQIGKTVPFAGYNWTVLEKKDNRLLLLKRRANIQKIYTNGTDVAWEKSQIKSWLEKGFLNDHFMTLEKEMIARQDQENGKGTAFLLSTKEYQKYQKRIPETEQRWWLQESGIKQGTAKCVTISGVTEIPANDKETYARPAVWVTLQ